MGIIFKDQKLHLSNYILLVRIDSDDHIPTFRYTISRLRLNCSYDENVVVFSEYFIDYA